MREKSFKNIAFHRINEMLKIYLDESLTLMKMNKTMQNALKKTYQKNSQWRKIMKKIEQRKNSNDVFDDIDFIVKNEQIYYASLETTFRICISWKLKKNVFQMIHDENHHCEFHKAYARVSIKVVYQTFNPKISKVY